MNKERKISETPDKWTILKMTNDANGTFYKVFASWAGGYLDGDRWKMNSGIATIEEDDNSFYFIGHSGSCYKCHKKGYGIMTSYAHAILDDIIEKSKEMDTVVEILKGDIDWNSLLNHSND